MFSLRNTFILAVVALLFIVLQGTVLRGLLGYATPNLLLILCVFLAFYEVSYFGACFAFLLGLLLDLSGAVLLGPWAGAFVAVYGALATLSQRLFIESPFAAFVATLFSGIVCSLVYLVLIYEVRSIPVGFFWGSCLEAFVTGLCAPPILGFLRRVFLRREIGMVRRGRTGMAI